MSKKILVVEDDQDLAGVIKTRLEALDYSVTTAENGQIGVERAKADAPDCIIMDVMMPVMDGFEACDVLKRDESTANIPILFLTAKDDDWDVLAGYARGGDCYITKPFDYDDLLSEITRMTA